MNLLHTAGTTDAAGSLTLTFPLGRPSTRYKIDIVAQPHGGREAASPVDVWTAINAFRERLTASGRVFADSVELIREDRDR